MGVSLIIAGASGLVGNHVIRQAAQMKHIDVVYSIGRSEVANMPNGTIHYKAETDQWAGIISDIGADIACSCLGTTIKKAGSQKAFAAVDLDLVHAFFRASKEAGAKHAISISSTMANAAAKQFYLRTKGQAELAIKALKFDRTDIIRPGLLRGERVDDYRLGERAAIIASPLIDRLLQGNYRKFRSIQAEKVAKAAAKLTTNNAIGYHIHEHDEILRLIQR